MVGFKFSSLIVFLSLLLVGCMPQNKQTDCGTNEAFSATLRSCVPIIPSSNSFINISTFTPSYSISTNKNSVGNIYLAIGISNPYNQEFTLSWRRNYNGLDTNFPDDNADRLNRNFTPASYSSQVGTHIITVQVLNSDNQIVDSHSWSITLTELPTPFLSNQVPLNAGIGEKISSPATQTLTIVANNNNGTVTGSTEIVWTLDGAVVQTCAISTPCYQTGPSQTTTNSYTTPAFNTMSIGNHTVSAILRDSSNIYSQFTWSFNVVNPPKARVSAVYIRDNDSNSNNQTVIARTGVPYSNVYDDSLGGSFRNFILTNAAQTSIYYDSGRTNFCIQFERDYGTQAGSYIDVRFYLDGNASPVATVSTTAGDNKVCLSDATAAELLNVVFNNANPNATENHTLSARIFDQAIMGAGKEYTYSTSDFLPGSGTAVYPVAWTIVVKPQNDAPTASFGATQLSSVLASTPLACTSTTTTEKAGCGVFTDTDFRISLLALKDDFYMLPFLAYADANFTYSLRLYRNTTLIHTCTKSTSGMDGTTDSTGPEFACTFNIPSFGASGPINTDLNTYHIEGEISDVGSPYSAYGAVAKSTSTFKWYLDVEETNTPPTNISIIPSSLTPSEGTTVNFNVSVDDVDRDNHKQEFYLCTKSAVADPTCSVNIPLSGMTQTSNRTSNALTAVVISSITLAEDFLHQLTDPTFNCRNLTRGQTCSGVRLLASITDIPSTVGATGNNVTQILTFDVVNTNPAPQYDQAQFSPDESLATHQAVVGVPFILNPGTITDATNALVLSERETRYQWYSSIDDTTWVTIPGATSMILNWTPASEIAASGNNVYLKLCMQDQPTYVIATVDEEVCTNDPLHGGSTSWAIRAHRNYVGLDGSAALPATKNLMAVWKGPESTNSSGQLVTPVFTSYVDSSNVVHVEKSVLNSTGGYLTSGFSNVSFDPRTPADALAGYTILDIKDLSMTGTNNSIYITYRLSISTTPTQYRFHMRRIDIGGTKSNIAFADNKTFGFSYNDLALAVQIPADISIGTVADTTGTWQSLQINNATDSNVTIGTTTLTPCASACSATAFATALVAAVNSSAAAQLQGIYATLNTSTQVLIKGITAQNNIYAISTNIGSMGQVYVSNNRWHVLFVSSTGKLAVFSAPTDEQLTRTAPTLTDYTVGGAGGLNTIQNSSVIAVSNVFNESGTDYVLVGSIGAAAITRAYKLEAATYSSATIDGSVSGLFGGAQTYTLKVAATNGVNKYFVVGDAYDSVTSQRNFFFVKLGSGMGVEVSKTVSDATFVNAATQSLFDYNGVYDVNLAAYTGGIARVFVISEYTSASPMMFNATLKADNTLSCHGCAPVSGGAEVSTVTSIALSQVRLKTSCVANGLTQAHCLLGTEGYDSTPGTSTDDANYKDIIFTGYTILENPSDFQPAVGVFNLQSESIHSSALDSANGKYRPAFFTP